MARMSLILLDKVLVASVFVNEYVPANSVMLIVEGYYLSIYFLKIPPSTEL